MQGGLNGGATRDGEAESGGDRLGVTLSRSGLVRAGDSLRHQSSRRTSWGVHLDIPR